ncbi:HBR119Wp [Eremothecium sinecaudum]|uniref:HBR119Wp n=1 Tax=Eremothecium sinecaudum TaxID=45286 RepID=A0A120K153_9SACH|nr:HBR119Wp [Eremothecium sinecaudum]AMD19020.1 HBR119Wp [Eremothecium sinecaudum]
MSRNTRRGQGVRDPLQQEEVALVAPSKILANILKTLDLTFDKEVCMLNGKFVRVLPDKTVLTELQGQLEKLDEVLAKIATRDQETVDIIRNTRDKIRKHEQNSSVNAAASKSVSAKNLTIAKADSSRKGKHLDKSSTTDLATKDPLPVNGFMTNTSGYVARSSASQQRSDLVSSGTTATESVGMSDTKIHSQSISQSDARQVDSKTSQRHTIKRRYSNTGEKGIFSEATASAEEPVTKKGKLDQHKISDDPHVKNPKSEFVVSQTLPVAAVQLGLFTDQGLESTGEEYLKKKYGVASYPTNDLKELLPGEIPDMDFTKPKPSNQIQYNTFLSSIENFFREFTDEDIKFLQTKYIIPQSLQVQKQYDPDVTPYVIPKLGHLYTETWIKEDNNQNVANITPPQLSDPISVLPKKSSSDLNDESLDTESISCGPLVSRLLSAILKDTSNRPQSPVKEEQLESNLQMNANTIMDDDVVPTPDMKYEGSNLTSAVSASADNANAAVEDIKVPTPSASAIPQQQGWKVPPVSLDYPTFEERLKRELRYVGIMSLAKDENGIDDPDWLNRREDDEISAELRELQNTLRQVTKRNEQRKTILVPLVEKQLAWQEYMSILDDLDKQVDQAYIKRIRVPKNKKKKHPTTACASNPNSTSQAAIQAAHQQAANSSLKSLLDKRQRWISNIGALFDKPEKMKRIPKESVFKDLDQEEEEEEGDVFGANVNNKDDEELGTDGLQK